MPPGLTHVNREAVAIQDLDYPDQAVLLKPVALVVLNEDVPNIM